MTEASLNVRTTKIDRDLLKFNHMISIFDFEPSQQELNNVRFDSLSLCQKFGIEIDQLLTPELYLDLVSQQNAYYDLAILFEYRNDQVKSDEFWAKLPKKLRYKYVGFDYEIVAI
jgi:hypothetical protein